MVEFSVCIYHLWCRAVDHGHTDLLLWCLYTPAACSPTVCNILAHHVLPLSTSWGTCASILIVLVFAAMPIGDRPTKKQVSSAIGGMFTNVTGIAIAQ